MLEVYNAFMDETIKQKIDFFFTQFKQQKYKKGEILIRADDTPSGIFYLKQGFVREYFISRNGDECVVNIFKPVSFFPMSWAINNTENVYFFEALNAVEVWKAPKERVLAFIKQEPDVLYDLVSRVYRGTDGLLTRMSYLMSGSAYIRVVAELLIQIKRFGQVKANTKQVTIKISEKDFAAQAGMTRETVSREIHILKEKKIIAFTQNTLTVSDLAALEKELSGG